MKKNKNKKFNLVLTNKIICFITTKKIFKKNCIKNSYKMKI